MAFHTIILQLLITIYSVFLQNSLNCMAVMMPQDDSIHINTSLVADLDEDGVPEVYLAAADGWEYYVYYYLDGAVYSVKDLTPWAWSSNLCYTADGRLVMCAFAHTTGTAGIAQYRVYEWTPSGYHLAEDLWRMPTEWNEKEEPVGFEYISSKNIIDPIQVADYTELLITQEEYEQKVAGFGDMTSIFTDGHSWDMDWWDQNGDVTEIYKEIQVEIVNW